MKKQFALLGFLALLIVSCAKPEKKHYTVIVSLDGFRWDYPGLYSTPALDGMAEKGVSAIMLPSFPASTFPNHYTLATGLVAESLIEYLFCVLGFQNELLIMPL